MAKRKPRKSSRDKELNKLLKRVYFDPENPGSYGGFLRLYRAVKKSMPDVTANEVKNWLSQSDVYTLHRDARVRFPRVFTAATKFNEQLQCDLVDMTQKIANKNDGNRYILTCIDILSKRAYAEPVKRKTGNDVANAFDKILDNVQDHPRRIHVDQGKEFFNAPVKALLKKYQIDLFHTYNETKAAIVERFIRTLKQRLWRIFTHNGNYEYTKHLKKVMNSYNNSHHRSIGMAPNKTNPSNEETVKRKLYGKVITPTSIKFNVNDLVRISKVKTTFRKSYLANWSDELFRIAKIYHTPKNVTMYKLHDLNNASIDGRFYPWELQKVQKDVDAFYAVESILKTRGTGKRKQHLIKWKGYGDEFNQWVNASEVQDVPPD